LAKAQVNKLEMEQAHYKEDLILKTHEIKPLRVRQAFRSKYFNMNQKLHA